MIELIEFHKLQLEQLIPSYGNTLDEVVKTILTHWLTEHGNNAIIYNDDVKRELENKK